METVEVVIKIPKQVYEHINVWKDIVYDDYIAMVTNAILNGTVLPKGHGALKDAHHIKEELAYLVYKNYHNKPMCDKLESIVDNALTIIEADKEE